MSVDPVGLLDPVSATTDVLVKALRTLGQAGYPDRASRLGAQAWWALKQTHPRDAERVNGVLHFLARLPAEEGAPHTDAPAAPAPLPCPDPTAPHQSNPAHQANPAHQEER